MYPPYRNILYPIEFYSIQKKIYNHRHFAHKNLLKLINEYLRQNGGKKSVDNPVDNVQNSLYLKLYFPWEIAFTVNLIFNPTE